MHDYVGGWRSSYYEYKPRLLLLQKSTFIDLLQCNGSLIHTSENRVRGKIHTFCAIRVIFTLSGE